MGHRAHSNSNVRATQNLTLIHQKKFGIELLCRFVVAKTIKLKHTHGAFSTSDSKTRPDTLLI
ncbi:hypothetical protein EXN66_Car010243 [Channa argus]|uniref:Uncharacterized protein n=1 Tax=Channa argus TaxID=215402 RepID=A0A6G1PWF0_CHAAH|nr:hypothetical protein EXN66_Car010243 [Channa argus]